MLSDGLNANFKAAVDAVVVHTNLPRPNPKAEYLSLDSKLLNSNPAPDRDFEIAIIPARRQYPSDPQRRSHVVTVQERKPSIHSSGTNPDGTYRFFFSSDLYDLKTVARAAPLLQRLLERWPHELKFTESHKAIIAATALELTCSDAVKDLPKSQEFIYRQATPSVYQTARVYRLEVSQPDYGNPGLSVQGCEHPIPVSTSPYMYGIVQIV